MIGDTDRQVRTAHLPPARLQTRKRIGGHAFMKKMTIHEQDYPVIIQRLHNMRIPYLFV